MSARILTKPHDADWIESRERDYYVTVKDAGRTGFLLGPYATLTDAKDHVDRGRELACDANSRAWFYAYGTSSLPVGVECRTVFGS